MNARSIIFLLLFGALLAGGADPARAQQFPFGSREHTDALSLDLGLSALQMRDDLLLRIRHVGPGFRVRLACDLAGRENLHTISLTGGAAVVANRYGPEALAATAGLAYGFAVKVPAWSDDRTTVYLGGMLSAVNDIQFYETIDEAHFYWLAMHDLRLRGVLRHQLGESSRLVAEVGIPIVALVARPERDRFYNNDMPRAGYIFRTVNDNLKVESWDRLQAADLRICYTLDIADRFSESIAYELGFRRSTDPDLYVSLAHSLHLSLAYTL